MQSELLQEICDALFGVWLNHADADAAPVSEMQAGKIARWMEKFGIDESNYNRMVADIQDVVCAAEKIAFYKGVEYAYTVMTAHFKD